MGGTWPASSSLKMIAAKRAKVCYRCGAVKGGAMSRRPDGASIRMTRRSRDSHRRQSTRLGGSSMRRWWGPERPSLVTSAACGADLLALSAAADIRLRRRVILPLISDAFSRDSVIDRPGDWGPLFDETMLQLQAVGDVLILDESPDDNGYAAVGEASPCRSRARYANGDRLVAMVVWDGTPARRRSDGAVSQIGRAAARNRGRPDPGSHG